MEKIYLIMNKPCGYVCAAASDSHKTVYELLTPELQALVQRAKRGSRLHTVGRLDCDTSGLLLLTTDGYFSHKITTSGIQKKYRATLRTPVTGDEQKAYITRAAAGLTLPPEKKYGEQQAEPSVLHFINSEICEITVDSLGRISVGTFSYHS